jgi:putative FmdB family regulatory protein
MAARAGIDGPGRLFIRRTVCAGTNPDLVGALSPVRMAAVSGCGGVMPTYEYACRDCGEHVEVVQSFRDEALTDCALCGGRLRRVFSAAGIIFKGTGYYATDSRKKPADDAKSKESTSTDKTTTAATEKKTESA